MTARKAKPKVKPAGSVATYTPPVTSLILEVTFARKEGDNLYLTLLGGECPHFQFADQGEGPEDGNWDTDLANVFGDNRDENKLVAKAIAMLYDL